MASAIRFGILTLFLGAVALVGYAQAPAQDLPARQSVAGIIRGRVLAAGSDAPLRNARVQATTDVGSPPPVFTDGDGQFVIPFLASGQYRLSATKAGYVATNLGGRGYRDPGTSLTVVNGSVADNLTLRMPKAAALSGRILDSLGEPVIGMPVSAELAIAATNGQSSTITIATARTDDLGDYRLGGLPEGTFIVRVNVTSPVYGPGIDPNDPTNFLSGATAMSRIDLGRGMGSISSESGSFYPGVPSAAQAQRIPLAAGEVRTSIDFDVEAVPARTVSEFMGIPPSRATYKGAIRGRIIDAEGRPIAQAFVTFSSDDFPSAASAVRTKEDGTYALSNLPTGTYIVRASKSGHISGEYGQRRTMESGEPITLRSSETRDRIDIVLPRPGAIAGQVVDDGGDPVEGAYLRVMQIRYESGHRRIVNVASVGGRRTDDTGHYRLYGLQPGQYIVGALVGQTIPDQAVMDLPGYAPTYFPGTANAGEARLLTVNLSQDVPEVDFALARVSTARVAGTAFDASGRPLRGNLILSPSRRSGAVAAMAVAATVRADGTFECLNVPPGEYVLQASPSRPSQSILGDPFREGEFASTFVAVNGSDVSGIVIRTSAGSTVNGHITLEGDGDPDFFSAIDVTARPVDMDLSPLVGQPPAAAQIRPDLTFSMGGLSGPRLFRLTRAPRGWALKAVLLNGVDVSDRPIEFGRGDQSLDDLEVVLTDRVSEISGQVTDARGRAVPDASVIVFASDRDKWSQASRFLIAAKTERDGTFSVRGLPPGDYFAAAVDLVAEGEWQDPDLLDSVFPTATRATLLEGDKISIDLRAITR